MIFVEIVIIFVILVFFVLIGVELLVVKLCGWCVYCSNDVVISIGLGVIL